MIKRTQLDKEFFSAPPILTNLFSAGKTKVQHGEATYSIESLFTLKQLLTEKRTLKEDPVLRFLVDQSGVAWFARETRPNNHAPKHYQMTGESINNAYCATAGNLKFKNATCTTLKSINHRSGDFHPSFHSLRLFLAILIVNEPVLPFKLPKILIVKEFDNQGKARYKHKWPVVHIKNWIAQYSHDQKLMNQLKKQAMECKIVHYKPVNFSKNDLPVKEQERYTSKNKFPLLRNLVRKLIHGFTLIEMLIVIVAVGLLIFIAYPSYTQFLIKLRRSEAWVALAQDQLILEHCYAQNFSYNQPCETLPVFPHTSPQGYYQITWANVEAKTYTLSAIPLGNQKKDLTCARFTVNQANLKTATDILGTMQPICLN
jgi:prepilin-type N-terminal cleavage/methylation domain-containing protein